ncbi:MAG: hypothetical protein ABSB80_07740 [Methanoregula sp.]|uniref:hypothetical protein n=1 Tax=Methanoregula sp. TaxID=2052170 RepID=UPI003D0ABC9D
MQDIAFVPQDCIQFCIQEDIRREREGEGILDGYCKKSEWLSIIAPVFHAGCIRIGLPEDPQPGSGMPELPDRKFLFLYPDK